MEQDYLREKLAEVQHEIWTHWMKYLFSRCSLVNVDKEKSFLVIPQHDIKRWKRQVLTPYNKLSEKEKESDRKQADKILKVLRELGVV